MRKKRSIYVRVGGARYPAEYDTTGSLRFRANGTLRYLVDSGLINLNEIADRYANERAFSLRAYAEFYMLRGYSVAGFCDLSFFEAIKVEAPHWIREGRQWRPSDARP